MENWRWISAEFATPNLAFAAGDVTSAFTYQGRLLDGQVPASGSSWLRFQLLDHTNIAIGTPIQELVDLADTSGLFTVSLDFGSSQFDGQQLFLEISVAEDLGGFPGTWTTLSPPQELTASPYSLHALQAQDGGAVEPLLCRFRHY